MNLGAQLSLQMHYQRAKHWVVASGMAEIINGDISRLHTENQSTYTPLRTVHRLKNPEITAQGEIPPEVKKTVSAHPPRRFSRGNLRKGHSFCSLARLIPRHNAA